MLVALFSSRDVVVGLKVTVFHWFTRFATLTEPKPGGHIVANTGLIVGIRQTRVEFSRDRRVADRDVVKHASIIRRSRCSRRTASPLH